MAATPPQGSGKVEKINSVTALILTVITCHLYEIFVWWPARMRAVNDLLGRQEFEFSKALLLTILTCGMMYVYYDFKIAEAIVQIRKQRGEQPSESLPLITFLVDLFGFGFISSLMQQEEINKIA